MTANLTPPDDLPSAHNHTGRVCDRHCPAWDHEAARRDQATPKTVIAATEKMLADAKADVGDSLVRLNEAILKGEL